MREEYSFIHFTLLPLGFSLLGGIPRVDDLGTRHGSDAWVREHDDTRMNGMIGGEGYGSHRGR